MQVCLDQRWIDRLVDDELSGAERRRLLELVEASPDGWKRVGTAFLEAQAWRSGLGDARAAGITPSVVASEPQAGPTAIPVRSLSRFGILRAACLLVCAFGLGFASRPLPRTDAEKSRPFVPDSKPIGNNSSVGESDPLLEPPRRIGRLELTTAQSGEFPAADVPIYEGGIPPEWEKSKTSIPSEVRAAWERKGYQLQERRELISVGLGDGRRAVVPVEDVEAKYVGQPVY